MIQGKKHHLATKFKEGFACESTCLTSVIYTLPKMLAFAFVWVFCYQIVFYLVEAIMKSLSVQPEPAVNQNRVKELYEVYAVRLLAYTKRCYTINEEDRISLVYKTIYKIAAVEHKYKFASEAKRNAFIFKTHINYLRNYFRDNKQFEHKNFEVELQDVQEEHLDADTLIVNPKLQLLETLLQRMQDWERSLLLLRGQDMPYSEIAGYVNKPEKHLKVYYARLKKQLLEDMNNLLKKANNENK